ncbi:basic helix-loop-helix domain containing protein [Musa troglodytarum]|uniref:Basic helix-loop-helix domain containing protein n=1 Tax=Musa troglodytarum TaxID=320322 RepID=A0A9E7IFM5_9LILI|nr:basic helix-loop-helix domain containing protein [Musa troglodytarum]
MKPFRKHKPATLGGIHNSLQPRKNTNSQPLNSLFLCPLSHIAPTRKQLSLDAVAAFHLNKTSIIMDASKYIEELKKKVDKLNREITCTQERVNDSTLPMVTVEALQKGFLVNISLGKSYPGLLVSILEAFEKLGLSVVQARATCTDTFHLEAVGGDIQVARMDAQMVKQAVLQAIKTSTKSSDPE